MATTAGERSGFVRALRGAVLIALVYLPVAAVLLYVRFQHFTEPQEFALSLRDRGTEWYSGSLAIAGFALWSIAALVGLAGALATRGVASLAPNRRFLLEAAAVSVMLGVDDALQLHDPATYGLPQALVLGVEALVVAVVLVTNWRLLLRADVGLLVVALGCGALWVAAKAGPGVPMRTGVESGAKFAAVVGWSVYVVRLAFRTSRLARQSRRVVAPTPVEQPTIAEVPIGV